MKQPTRLDLLTKKCSAEHKPDWQPDPREMPNLAERDNRTPKNEEIGQKTEYSSTKL